ncbi:hypothetical protein [Deinococcus knuensis]|uniref:Uncharacterized protein n=1 Tax=Deinococcus knuensis TaxID=1837380 RepID=A0ABQ2S9U5_9DEIO|nr:hypothetical protein [Deinococcus knuensis]GGS13013.1 hypothetical protein GCM10008961_00100 [Deinococcus knuensis]
MSRARRVAARRMASLALSLAVTVNLSGVQAATRPLTLKPTHGGALLIGTLSVPRADELTGVWSSVGRARLMRCLPNCEVVKAVPVPGSLNLNDASAYRVVLGGTFKAGQKISLVLRYRNAQIVNLTATVAY